MTSLLTFLRPAIESCRTFPFLLALSLLSAPATRAQTVVDTTRTYRIDEVVVTGSTSPTQRSLLPYTVTTVGSHQIEASGRTQLLSALSAQVPSLFVSERNIFGFGVSTGGSGAIKIRGIGGSPTSQVLMMVDGQPQFAGIFSHHVADAYEAEYVDRVEVLRGPASVLYGSNAMGGVINVITKGAHEKGIHTMLSSQYGSYNTWQSALTNTVRAGRFSSLVSLGYDRTDGVQDGFDFRQASLYAKLGYDLSSQWSLRADYSLMNFIGNDPVYAQLSDPESTDVYHQNITRGAASLTLADTYRRASGLVRIYYSYGNHFIDDPTHFHGLDDRLGITAYQNIHPWTGADATVGMDFDTYSGKIPMQGGKAHSEGSLTTISRKHTTEYSPYITLMQRLWGGRLTLNAGLRLAMSDRFPTEWVPQGGLALQPGQEWTIKASVAKGFRNPSFRELYLYQAANPDLEPESMVNYELSLGKAFGRALSLDLTAYYSHGSNLIQTVDMLNVNTGRFTNKGIEFSLQSQPCDALSLRASYSYLHTTLDSLVGAPKHQYYLGLTWRALTSLTIDTELRGIDSLYVADSVSNQDYALLNIRASWQALKLLQVFASLNNLTDAQYVINRGYEMPGINCTAGLKLSL